MTVLPGPGIVDDSNPPYRFRVRTPIEIADTDLGGIVYYGRYARLWDRALVAYRRHLGIPPLGPHGHLLVMRRTEVDYLGAPRFGDEVDVWVRTAEIGRTSHTLELAMDDASSGAPRARARLVMVGVASFDSARPTRIPEEFARALRAFEDGRPNG